MFRNENHLLNRRNFIFLSSGLIVQALSPLALLAGELSKILAFRYSTGRSKIRIVADIDSEVTYDFTHDPQKNTLFITLKNCLKNSQNVRIEDPSIASISVSEVSDTLELAIAFTVKMETKVFHIPSDAKNTKPYRLVIDLIRQTEPVQFRSEQREAESAPLHEAPVDEDIFSIINADSGRLEELAKREEQERIAQLDDSKGTLQFGIKRIVIDPGHGGFDSGAVGSTGLQEKEVALSMAQYLASMFKKETDITPYLTRNDDYYVPLGERTTIANQYRADLFVSIHINAAGDKRAEGLETFYCSETASDQEAARLADYENSVGKDEDIFREDNNFISVEKILAQFERRIYWTESARFADIVQNQMLDYLKGKNRKVRYANFFVLRRAKMPSLLAEMGFISNPKEEKLLKTDKYQRDAATAIFKGILSYTQKK